MVKMRRKYYVVYLTIATLAFIVFQAWFMLVYLHPPETPPGYHIDPLPNYTLIPGTVLFTVGWLCLLYRRQAA